MTAEFFAVYQFLEAADRVGLEVAGDNQVFRLRSAWQDVMTECVSSGEWPPPAILETLALAQHHGVPTRLLDFTENPLAAAFFAVRENVERESKSRTRRPPWSHSTVWAVNVRKIGNAYSKNAGRIRTVHVPRAKNVFLHAQQGLFIYDSKSWKTTSGSLTEGIEEVAQTSSSFSGCEKPWVIRIDVPSSCAQKTAELLEVEGINEPSLMPSLQNVVRYLKKKTYAEARIDRREGRCLPHQLLLSYLHGLSSNVDSEVSLDAHDELVSDMLRRFSDRS